MRGETIMEWVILTVGNFCPKKGGWSCSEQNNYCLVDMHYSPEVREYEQKTRAKPRNWKCKSFNNSVLHLTVKTQKSKEKKLDYESAA